MYAIRSYYENADQADGNYFDRLGQSAVSEQGIETEENQKQPVRRIDAGELSPRHLRNQNDRRHAVNQQVEGLRAKVAAQDFLADHVDHPHHPRENYVPVGRGIQAELSYNFV